MKEVENAAKAGMEAVHAHLAGDLKSIRTGRATPSLLDRVIVADEHGHTVPLKVVASTSVSEGRNLLVTPHHGVSVTSVIKGIEAANLGLGQPRADGKLIRISIQPLTTETRKQLAGECKKYADKAKISLRKVRQDIRDKLKKLKADKAMTEDVAKKCDESVDALIKTFEKKVDTICAEKEKEIMTI